MKFMKFMKQLFESGCQYNGTLVHHTISHDTGVDITNTCFLSPFDKFSNSSEVPHKL